MPLHNLPSCNCPLPSCLLSRAGSLAAIVTLLRLRYANVSIGRTATSASSRRANTPTYALIAIAPTPHLTVGLQAMILAQANVAGHVLLVGGPERTSVLTVYLVLLIYCCSLLFDC